MTTKDPVARLGNPMDWPDCEEFHLDLSSERLGPLELVKSFTSDVLADLDYRARAITFRWHEGEKLEQDIMAVATALPKLTAMLRKMGDSPCS